MITFQEISAQTGLARSNAMYPKANCKNGWRLYALRRAREITHPLFQLARAGDVDALAAELRAAGELAALTKARCMIRAAARAGDLPAVKWVRDDRNWRIGALTLHWDGRGRHAGEWNYWPMFGA